MNSRKINFLGSMSALFRRHWLYLVLVAALCVYFGFKISSYYSWDDWAFGSAQTMMTMEHWRNEGMAQSKFLFAPVGYSKTVKYLDEPEMRHHAKGTATGQLIGNRLYYTHYPSGYLIPYGLLAKIGFVQRHWFRILAVLFSLGGLSLMYGLFYLISNKYIAFIATLFYASSLPFLGLADSLANMPVDDFLRFLILFLSVYSLKKASADKKIFYDAAIWMAYLALSLSSYDSTFFVFVWLVGLDIIAHKKFLWKRWLVLSSAPIFAFGLQFLQNAWYLGYRDAVLDMYGSFKFRADTGPGTNIVERHARAMFSPLVYMINMQARFAIPATAALFLLFWKFKNKIIYSWPKTQYLILLAAAGFAYPFVLSSSAYFPYQARQIAPFISLLLACAIALVFFLFKNRKITAAVFLSALVAWFLFLHVKETHTYVKQWSPNQFDQKLTGLAAEIKSAADGRDAVAFRLDTEDHRRYPQAEAVFEYYSGLPVLSFNNPEDLKRDLTWLKSRSEFPFKAVVVVKNEEVKNRYKLSADIFVYEESVD